MAKRAVHNKDTTISNQLNFEWWRTKLVDFYMTLYKWHNLPFDKKDYRQVENYLNFLLLDGGTVGFTYIEGDIPIIGHVVPCEGYNWFGGASKYTITNKVNSYIKDKNDIAIGFNSPSRHPMYYLIDHYAKLLSEIDGVEDVNLKTQHTPVILAVPHGQELSASNMYEQIAGHKPVVYGRDTLIGNNQKIVEHAEPSKYICDKLELLRGDILNSFYNDLGVAGKTAEKRAQLVTAEINAGKESVSVFKNIYLDSRKRFCDAINEIFDLKVSVEFNAERIEEIEIAVEHALDEKTSLQTQLRKQEVEDEHLE